MPDSDPIDNVLEDILEAATEADDVDPDLIREIVRQGDIITDAIDTIEEAPDPDELEEQYEQSRYFRLLVNHLQSSDRYPSYIDNFINALSTPPYTTPSNLYEPEGACTINVQTPQGLQEESATLALQTLFPGSISYRYGRPAKTITGPWYQDLRAHLRNHHELTEGPIFEVEHDGRPTDVYGVRTLRTRQIRSPSSTAELICPTCLSLWDEDEDCGHPSDNLEKRSPSSYSIIRQTEIDRDISMIQELRLPLRRLIDTVRFSYNLEIGTAVVGFERNAQIHNTGRSVLVDFEPPIGTRIQTSGLVFDVNVDEDIIEGFLDKEPITRDMAVQILANRISAHLQENGIPIYNHEIILSAIVEVIDLNGDIGLDEINDNLLSDDMADDIIAQIHEEDEFYENLAIDFGAVRDVLDAVQQPITPEDVLDRVRDSFLHTLGHQIMLACTVTAGAESNDLDYLIDGEEVIVFDTDNGGNGSSEMVHEFLAGEDDFDIRDFRSGELYEDSFRPKYFDETLFEFLLPCVNSVAERSYLFNDITPPDRRFVNRIRELAKKEATHTEAFDRLRDIGSQHIYPASIGYHAVDYSTDPQEGDRFHELAQVCIHGCPECTVIGTGCSEGQFVEKYSISKRIQDLYFRELIDDNIIDISAGVDRVLDQLESDRLVILTSECSDEADCEDARQKLLDTATSIDGQETDDRFVKFAGFWLDVRPSDNLEYAVMLVTV
jgi:hypothetical protein